MRRRSTGKNHISYAIHVIPPCMFSYPRVSSLDQRTLTCAGFFFPGFWSSFWHFFSTNLFDIGFLDLTCCICSTSWFLTMCI
jgi:hypothetical protein